MLLVVDVVLVQMQEHLRPTHGGNACSYKAMDLRQGLEKLGRRLCGSIDGDRAQPMMRGRGARAGRGRRSEGGAEERWWGSAYMFMLRFLAREGQRHYLVIRQRAGLVER